MSWPATLLVYRRAIRADHYVALLRGINVGGKNLIPMAELRAGFEADGYEAVSTHLVTGNVLFASADPGSTVRDSDIEEMLERRFGISLVVVVKSYRQYRNIVDKRPAGFGDQPDTYHSDVVFLKPPLTARQAMRVVAMRDGVDQAWTGSGVIYFQRLSAERTKSKLSSIMGTPEYQQMTIRSWSTTTKLMQLLEERRSG